LSYFSELHVVDLGLIPYKDACAIQESLHEKIKDHGAAPHILLCQHPPVITLGTSGQRANILTDDSVIMSRSIEVIKTTRGGDVTYHGPDQLMIYPLLDLRQLRKDIGWYMRTLEEAVIQTLQTYAIKGERYTGNAGVWIHQPHKKISSIGVRLRRWCTLHGVALNVYKDRHGGFELIAPCGFTKVKMTSIEEELQMMPQIEKGVPSIDDLKLVVIEKIRWAFEPESDVRTKVNG
jgi:lipoyl(octanoyl) transferase